MEKIGETTFFLNDRDKRLLCVDGSYMEEEDLKKIDVMALCEEIARRDEESAEIMEEEYADHYESVKPVMKSERYELSMDAVAVASILEHVTAVATAEDFVR